MGRNINSAKPLKDSELVKYWSLNKWLMSKVWKETGLYLEDIHIMSVIYLEGIRCLRPINRKEIIALFPIMTFKLDKSLIRLESKGFIKDESIRPLKRGVSFKLSLTMAGEQLLIKYDRSLRKMAHTTNRYLPDFSSQ